jgi:hypothetical protein
VQLLRFALQRDQHASQHSARDGVRIENGNLFGDHAAGSIPGQSALHGTGGEAYQVAQLVERTGGVALQ